MILLSYRVVIDTSTTIYKNSRIDIIQDTDNGRELLLSLQPDLPDIDRVVVYINKDDKQLLEVSTVKTELGYLVRLPKLPNGLAKAQVVKFTSNGDHSTISNLELFIYESEITKALSGSAIDIIELLKNIKSGISGKSAYQVAKDNGFQGTETEWLRSLIGPVGPQGIQGRSGINGTNGVDGKNGKSSYELWRELGHTGSTNDFMEYLRGPQGIQGLVGPIGPKGDQGTSGKSAYDIWVGLGHHGTEEDFINYLKSRNKVVEDSSTSITIDGLQVMSEYREGTKIFKEIKVSKINNNTYSIRFDKPFKSTKLPTVVVNTSSVELLKIYTYNVSSGGFYLFIEDDDKVLDSTIIKYSAWV